MNHKLCPIHKLYYQSSESTCPLCDCIIKKGEALYDNTAGIRADALHKNIAVIRADIDAALQIVWDAAAIEWLMSPEGFKRV